MQDTAGKVSTNSYMIYSSRLLHMDDQRQDDQLEHRYSSSVLIWDIALKTCWKQWTIEKGGERGSGICVLMVRYDDHDGIYKFVCVCVYIYI